MNQIPGEDVVAGCYRRVGGEQGGAGNGFQCGFKIQPRGHDVPATFENLERRMTLVDVPHRRFQAQCLQHTGSTDAQKHLLADPGGLVASV